MHYCKGLFSSFLLWCWAAMCCFLLLKEDMKVSMASLCSLLCDCGSQCCWRFQNRAGVGLSPSQLNPLSFWAARDKGFLYICFMDICGPFRHNHNDSCIFQLHTLWLFLQSAVELPGSPICKASAYINTKKNYLNTKNKILKKPLMITWIPYLRNKKIKNLFEIQFVTSQY